MCYSLPLQHHWSLQLVLIMERIASIPCLLTPLVTSMLVSAGILHDIPVCFCVMTAASLVIKYDMGDTEDSNRHAFQMLLGCIMPRTDMTLLKLGTHLKRHTCHIANRAGQNRIYTPYMTIYSVNSLPKERIYRHDESWYQLKHRLQV